MPNEKPPIVYQSHPLTGEYVGQSFADPDPLDQDNWLIPGMAFTEKPPEVALGFAAVHVQGSDEVWSVLQDLRGTVYQTEDGQPLEWSQFGTLPETLTIDPRPSPFHKWVKGVWKLDDVAESEALTRQALTTRDELIQQAATRISPLQYAVDLGDATADDEVSLKKWKQYSVALNRIDQRPGFPANIDWPVAPS